MSHFLLSRFFFHRPLAFFHFLLSPQEKNFEILSLGLSKNQKKLNFGLEETLRFWVWVKAKIRRGGAGRSVVVVGCGSMKDGQSERGGGWLWVCGRGAVALGLWRW